MWPDEDSRGHVKTARDAWRLVLCFPKLRSGLFEEQGTPYSTEWFQIDFNESEQVWEGPLVPFKINLELFSSFRGSLLPKQITGKKLHFRKHGTGKKTAGDAWRQQGTRENSRGCVKTPGDAWKHQWKIQGTRTNYSFFLFQLFLFHIIFFFFISFFFFIYFNRMQVKVFLRAKWPGFPFNFL